MFEPRSTDALVEAIEKFIAIPYEKKREMGLAGRKKVEKEFNRQVIVEAYMQAIEKADTKEFF
jgi:galacturonosyltransferase